jgi:hypothetical protein
MRTFIAVGSVATPVVLAAAAIVILKRYGLASPRVVSVVTFAALAVSIGNGVFLVFQLMKK